MFHVCVNDFNERQVVWQQEKLQQVFNYLNYILIPWTEFFGEGGWV